MNGYEFFQEMAQLAETGQWETLEYLLEQEHPTVPGEREIFLELCSHKQELGHRLLVRLCSEKIVVNFFRCQWFDNERPFFQIIN